MNQILTRQLMAERIESLKAGILSGFCFTVSFVMITLINSVVLAKYDHALTSLAIDTLSWHFLISGGIAAFCGLLFGVTYRYIVRSDKNFQLKVGGVLAFGLIRGLSQADVMLSYSSSILPSVVMGIENILLFGLAAYALDTAMQLGLIKPFKIE